MSETIRTGSPARFTPARLGRLAVLAVFVLVSACSGSDAVDPLGSASFSHNPGHGTPPSQVTSLAIPQPVATVTGSTVTVSWQPIPNANEYHVVVDTVLASKQTTSTSVVYTNVAAGAYKAKVRAEHNAPHNGSNYSGWVTFTVASTIVTPPVVTPPVTPPAGDNTPPVIAGPVISGTLGSNGWYTSDVTVIWTATDAESAVTLNGCSVSVTSNTEGATYTCTATSAGGSSTASITIKRDASTPSVVANPLTGTMGLNGWYTSNVGVSFDVSANGPSGVSSTGCTTQTVTADGSFSFTCAATSGAGLSSSSTAAGKKDASRPSVDGNLVGTMGSNGWYRSNVGVSFNVSPNGPSDIGSTSGCTAQNVTADGSFSFTCTATSGAGLSSSATGSGKKDSTVPVVAFAGNSGSYTVDATIAITCSATDATSGVDTKVCPSASGAAYLFNIGSNVLLGSATDYAGNVGGATASFTVSVTAGSLCNLTRRFVSHVGIANSLCVKLNAAEAAAARGNLAAKAGPLNAYVKEVQAQTGKSISAANAAILIRLAGLL